MMPRRGLVSLVLTFFGSALVVAFRTPDPSLMPLGGAGLVPVTLPVAGASLPPVANNPPPATVPPVAQTGPANPPATAGSAPAVSTAPVVAAASGYRDGTYAGAGEQTPFEVIAVQVIIKGGQIVDVSPTTLSGSRGRSNDINSYAVPILRSEVLAAQSAQINAVGGATWTSQGYAASLQSALDTAHA